MTSKLLFSEWSFAEGERDLTALRVTCEGTDPKLGRLVRRRWEMVDRYHEPTRTRSMSRTTGFPATIVAGMLARGEFDSPGVHPPEAIGRIPGKLAFVLAELERRGVRVRYSEQELG